ncbi:MAG: hypothetical protein U1E27_05275, partial [Kiritimatiellia bacterium]|nr:hypothetical protein [Kiritimatiellia bacterium]
NAHEQKMGAVIGVWRGGFYVLMIILLSIGAFTMMNSPKFEAQASRIRNEISWKAMNDISKDPAFTAEIPATEVIEARKAWMEENNPAQLKTATTISHQMRVPVALRHMLPVGVTGILCAIAIFLMVSTDTTYLHSWGSIIVQDVILPIRGRAFTPRQQIRLLRWIIAGVAAFAYFFSSLFAQMDFIIMFFAITGAIWTGGAGACIVFGLYWKRGTTAAAWTSLICGSSIAVAGIVLQQTWVGRIYPWMVRHDAVERANGIFSRLSSPFEPYILWRVTPTQFPINSQELLFIGMLASLILYTTLSLLTCRTPFNMDRLLHRGKYHREGLAVEKTVWTWHNFYKKIIGINEQYTRADRILAYSVFAYSFGYNFVLVFLGIWMWNAVFGRWPQDWWATWFYIHNVVESGIIGLVSTVWFSYAGTKDLLLLFKRLDARGVADVLDDGRVEGHVSADDLRLVRKVESAEPESASDPK